MNVFAQGELHERVSNIINLRCRLIQAQSGEVIASVGGRAALSESQWAMLGRAASLKPEGNSSPPPWVVTQASFDEEERIDLLDECAADPHPLLDPKFPYRIKVMIGGKVAAADLQWQ